MNDGSSNGTSIPVIGPATWLETTIKNGGRFELGPRTVVQGENETGKTRILDAFRLAWLGSHPIGPHAKNLLGLVPEGASELLAAIGGADWESRLRAPIKGGKLAQPGDPVRRGAVTLLSAAQIENALPMIAFGGVVGFGSTLGREQLVRRWGKVESADPPPGLSPSQREAWRAGLAVVATGATRKKRKAGAEGEGLPGPAEQLQLLAEHFRAQKIAKSAEMKAAAEALAAKREMIARDVAGIETLPQLERQHVLATAWERSAAIRAARERIEAEVAMYREQALAFHARQSDTAQAELARTRAKEDAALDEAVRTHEAALAEVTAAYEADVEAARTKAEADHAAAVAAAEAATAEPESLTAARAQVEAARATLAYEERLLRNGYAALDWVKTAIEHRDDEGKTPCLLCGNPDFAAEEAQSVVIERVATREESVARARAALGEADAALAAALAEQAVAARAGVPPLETMLADAVAGVDRSAVATQEARVEEARAAKQRAAVVRAAEDEAAAQEAQRLLAWHGRLKAAREENDRALAALEAPAEYVGPTAADLGAQVAKLRSARDERVRLDNDAAALETLEAEHALMQTMEAKVGEHLDLILRDTAARAEAAVAAFAPFPYKLDLEDARWTALGTDGRPHPRHAMTGAQETALWPAVCAAWGQGNPALFVLLDDRDTWGLSDRNFARLLDRLGQAQADGLITQLIVATWRPVSALPGGFTRIVLPDVEPTALDLARPAAAAPPAAPAPAALVPEPFI